LSAPPADLATLCTALSTSECRLGNFSSEGPAQDVDSEARAAEEAAAKAAQIAALEERIQQAEETAAAAAAAADEAAKLKKELSSLKEEMHVDAWDVSGVIDYNKLIDQFGSQRIDPKLLARIEKITVGSGRVKALHPWLRRGIFFSHRDLDHICTLAEQGKPFYLYTGRGPSSESMHLGHLIPFMMTQWLQQAFGVPLVIQMTDDEKFLWKGHYDPEKGDNLMDYRRLTSENAKDIIACGFNKSQTFIFSDVDYMGHMYSNVVRIWKCVTYNSAKAQFGFSGESNIGQSAFPAIQAAPSFPSSFKIPLGLNTSPENGKMGCLIPCAIDQDPYFRMTRDIAHKMVVKDHPLKGKPSLIHSKFFPPLQGSKGKMSASNVNSAVYLTDSDETIANKINEHAFSGGQMTGKLQKEHGANLDDDVAYQWLRFFLEDDKELEEIGKDYSTGSGKYWCTSEVKKRLIALLQDMVAKHRVKRAQVTEEEVASFMSVRALNLTDTAASPGTSQADLESYIQKHNLRVVLQEAVSDVVSEQPADPLAALSKKLKP